MNSSRRFNRRIRISFDTIKDRIRKLIPLFILIVVVLVFNSFLTIKKINCSLNNNSCPKEIQRVVDRLIGTNSLFVNKKELFTSVKAAYPIDKISINQQFPNTLNINLEGTAPYVQVDVYFVNELPILSMDQAPSTTDSGSWWVKPSQELETFTAKEKILGFDIWEDGSMTPNATTGAKIKFIFSTKPTSETISSIFKLIKVVLKYIDISSIYIVNNRCFLSRQEQPDIIIGVPFDDGSLVSALQSVSYLATIKKNAKVIDLSFKNPIIR